MIALLALLAAAPAQIDHLDRRPLAMIVVAPLREAKVTKTSELIDAASEVLARDTDLVVHPLEPELVRECSGDASCMARRAQSEAPGARFLAVFSALPRDDADLLSAMLIDVPEGKIAEELARAEVSTSTAARAFVAERFAAAWRTSLDRAGHIAPFGTIVLTANAPAVLMIDGELVGPIAEGTTEIKTRAGKKKLALDQWSRELELPRSSRVEVQADLAPRIYRTAVETGGLAAGALGAILTAYGFLAADRDTQTWCLYEDDRRASCGEGDRFPGGMKEGIALATFGLTAALATTLELTDDEPPWIETAIALAAGAAAFGVLSALDGEAPR